MLESSSGGSETRPDNSVVERLDADDYCKPRKKSNNGVNNFVGPGTNRYYDGTTTGNDENIRTSETKILVDDLGQISREVNSSPTVAELERCNGELSQDSWTERITNNFIGDVVESQESYFVTGSSYEGSWDALGMAGVGRYVMPNGTTYKGELRDGMFHGRGSLYWTKKGRLDVVHVRGELKEHRYVFDDGLVYEENNWNYCKFPDRRFVESKKKGLRPGGRALKTARQPTTILPFNCYDTGDGVYDPKTMRVTSYDDSKKVLRIPSQKECDWIVRNCRKSWTEPTGYRPELNENWSNDPPELPYNLAMSEDSPDFWWQRLTTFARDLDYLGDGRNDDTSDQSFSSPEVCMCGKYVIIGEPCHCTPISVTSEGEGHEVSEGTFSEQPPYDYNKDDEAEREKGFFSPSEDFIAYRTLDSATVAAISKDRLEKIRQIEKIRRIQRSTEFSEIDVDFSSSASGELFEDSSSTFADEISRKTRESRKRSKNVKVQQVTEKTGQRGRIKDEKQKNKVKVQSYEKFLEKSEEISDGLMKNEVLQKFGEDRDENNNEKSEGLGTDKISNKVDKELGEKELESRKSVEKSHKEKHKLPKENVLDDEIFEKATEEKSLSTSDKMTQRDHKNDTGKKDLTNEESHEKSGKKSDAASIDPTRKEVSQKFIEETGKGKIEEPAGATRGELPREIDEGRREKDYESRDSIKERKDRKSVEERPKAKHELTDGDVLDEKLTKKNDEERSDVSDDKREISLKKSDYETISTRGEKVARSVEPETGDDRRPETKLLTKDITEKYHDRSTNDNEIESAEKKSRSDLTIDPSNENKDNVIEYSMHEAEMRSKEKVIAESTTIREKINGNGKSRSDREKSIDEILPDETKNKKLREDETSVEDKITSEITFPGTRADIVDKTKSDGQSRSELFDEKLPNEMGKKLKIGLESKSKGNDEANLATSVVRKKITGRSVLRSVEESSELLKSTAIEKSRSIASLDKEEAAISSVSLKDELASMAKVHPSLANLASTKLKNVGTEKEIIEIYKGKPRGKPKIESQKTNVWRLSGVNEDYGPKTKIENLLFHPALTAPRSENVEYVRKPCDFRVCEPTIREVRPNASRPRKECPIDVPVKCITKGKK